MTSAHVVAAFAARIREAVQSSRLHGEEALALVEQRNGETWDVAVMAVRAYRHTLLPFALNFYGDGRPNLAMLGVAAWCCLEPEHRGSIRVVVAPLPPGGFEVHWLAAPARPTLRLVV